MTSDLDELRTVLRARAALAPAPDDLLPHTRRLAGGRRTRRRIALTAGVVIATAFALVVADLVGFHPHDRSAVVPGPPLPQPILPFTVGFLPPGYQLSNWTLSRDSNAVEYVGSQTTDSIGIESDDHDPVAGASGGTTTTVRGRPATLLTVNQLSGSLWQLSWLAAPDRWLTVSAPVPSVPSATVRSVADSVTLAPTLLPSILHIAHLPDDLQVLLVESNFPPGSHVVDVTLCRPYVHVLGPPDQRGCVDLRQGAGTAPVVPFDVLPGHVVRRQIDPTHWVAAYSRDLPTSLLTELIDLATVS